jgi:hypothetical protein
MWRKFMGVAVYIAACYQKQAKLSSDINNCCVIIIQPYIVYTDELCFQTILFILNITAYPSEWFDFFLLNI